MYHIIDALVRLLAPILTFTSEEIWSYLPNQTSSVQMSAWPEVDDGLHDELLEEKWQAFFEFRKEVAKALEKARVEKKIGNSLEAKVAIYPTNAHYNTLKSFQHDLAELFIVSQATLAQSDQVDDQVLDSALVVEEVEGTTIAVYEAQGEKCPRCWNFHPDVGQDNDLCPRCHSVVS